MNAANDSILINQQVHSSTEWPVSALAYDNKLMVFPDKYIKFLYNPNYGVFFSQCCVLQHIQLVFEPLTLLNKDKSLMGPAQKNKRMTRAGGGTGHVLL